MISAPGITADIDVELGGRIRSLVIGDTEVLVTAGAGPMEWGIYPLVPFAGRVRDAVLDFGGRTYRLERSAPPHAIHGTVLDVPWEVSARTDSSISMTTTTGPRWPFAASVRHDILVTTTLLRCVLTLTAHESMPAQVGWHPWFAHPDRVTTDFNTMLRRDPFGITTLEEISPAMPPVDDCFLEPNSWPRVHFGATRLEIASDCPYWVRYDAPSGHVCIEPQSGPPDGINTRPYILEAGQQLTRWMEIRHLTHYDDA